MGFVLILFGIFNFQKYVLVVELNIVPFDCITSFNPYFPQYLYLWQK